MVCREQQRNVQRIITHVQTLNLSCSDIPVAVMVFLNALFTPLYHKSFVAVRDRIDGVPMYIALLENKLAIIVLANPSQGKIW